MTTNYVVDPDMWEAFDTLRHAHIYNARGYRIFSGGLPVILICSDDDQLGDVDLVAASNFATIREALADDETVKVATGPYSDALYALADEEGNPVSGEVAAIVRALEEYPLFDERDYAEREQEYIDANLGDALFDAFRYGDTASVDALDWAMGTPTADMVAEYQRWREETGADYPMVTGGLDIPDADLFIESINRRFV